MTAVELAATRRKTVKVKIPDPHQTTQIRTEELEKLLDKCRKGLPR